MKKVMFVGIAGTDKDFLLSIPTLVAYLKQHKEVTDNYNLIQQHYFKSADIFKIVEDIVKESPDIICFSQYIWNKKMVEHLVNFFKGKQIVVGGPDVSNSYVDGLVTYINGEGEYKLYTYLTGLIPPHQPYSNRPSFIDEIKELLAIPEIRVNIETQRGCSFACSYCMYHKNMPKLEYKNVDTVLDELEIIQEHVKEIRIIDGNFFSNYNHAKSLIEGLLCRNINLRIFFESSPILINESLLKLCKQYIERGNKLIMSIGVQSTNQKALKAVNRFRNGMIEEDMIDKLSKSGISLRIDSILGLPYDNSGDYLETLNTIINYMEYGEHYLGPNVLRILPGTELYEKAPMYGMHCDDTYLVTSNSFMDEEDFVYCLRKTAIAFRLFSSYNLDTKSGINDLFFKTKYKANLTNIAILDSLEKALTLKLQKESPHADFLKKDFPRAENYYYWTIRWDAPDEWIKQQLEELQ